MMLLMEEENKETQKWFEPGIEYVAFRNERDLLEKVRYYLSNPREMQAIARRGAQKAATCYSAEAFWRRFFKLVID